MDENKRGYIVRPNYGRHWKYRNVASHSVKQPHQGKLAHGWIIYVESFQILDLKSPIFARHRKSSGCLKGQGVLQSTTLFPKMHFA